MIDVARYTPALAAIRERPSLRVCDALYLFQMEFRTLCELYVAAPELFPEEFVTRELSDGIAKRTIQRVVKARNDEIQRREARAKLAEKRRRAEEKRREKEREQARARKKKVADEKRRAQKELEAERRAQSRNQTVEKRRERDAERVERLLREKPDASNGEIERALGFCEHYVRLLLREYVDKETVAKRVPPELRSRGRSPIVVDGRALSAERVGELYDLAFADAVFDPSERERPFLDPEYRAALPQGYDGFNYVGEYWDRYWTCFQCHRAGGRYSSEKNRVTFHESERKEKRERSRDAEVGVLW